MPPAKGKPATIWGYFDADHAGCLVTRQSTTSVLLFLNKTPVKWYSKRQNTVETSTYGSEVVAGRIAVDLVVELRYKLRMLGVPVVGPSKLFGDNQSMVTTVSLPHSILKKKSNACSYHRCREAVASRIVDIIHCKTDFNLADMGTKALPGKKHLHLLHNQVFPPPVDEREYDADIVAATQHTWHTQPKHSEQVVNHVTYASGPHNGTLTFWKHETAVSSDKDFGTRMVLTTRSDNDPDDEPLRGHMGSTYMKYGYMSEIDISTDGEQMMFDV